MARLNLIDTVYPNGTAEQPIDYEARPDWMKNWEVTGLLQFEDKNGDGKIQWYNDNSESFAATAQERGWTGSELSVNRDILVLANPEIARLPGWVIALVAAGGLAAALSTAAGLLLAISGAVSHDLIKGQINPNISEKGELLAARIAMAGAIAVATYLGLNPPGFAAQTVALAFGLAAASIFPALMMGIFSKRINNKGAVAGMLAGLIFTLSISSCTRAGSSFRAPISSPIRSRDRCLASSPPRLAPSAPSSTSSSRISFRTPPRIRPPRSRHWSKASACHVVRLPRSLTTNTAISENSYGPLIRAAHIL
jgi:probable sodium:solute symporter